MADFKGFMSTEATIEELRLERHLWKMLDKNKRQYRIHDTASKMAKVNRSDPFTYDRVFSSLAGNFTTPEDYRNQLQSR